MKWDLVAIGNPVYDEIKTPLIATRGRVLSGCSTNACLAAVKLGLRRVGFVGCVGPDYKRQFMADLEKYSVTPIHVIDSEETGGFRLIYKEDGDRTLTVLGKAGNITVDDLPSGWLNAQMIAVGPILGEVGFDVLEYIVENSDAGIFIDPQGFLREIQYNGKIKRVARGNVLERLACTTTFLKPNEHEAHVLTGSLDHKATAERFVELGCQYGIVTLADRGSIITDGQTSWKIPAYPTTAKDPTGAGDTYMGSFIYSWLKRKGAFHDHALFASAAASCMVEFTGPDFEMPLHEVQKRVSQIQNSVQQI